MRKNVEKNSATEQRSKSFFMRSFCASRYCQVFSRFSSSKYSTVFSLVLKNATFFVGHRIILQQQAIVTIRHVDFHAIQQQKNRSRGREKSRPTQSISRKHAKRERFRSMFAALTSWTRASSRTIPCAGAVGDSFNRFSRAPHTLKPRLRQ